MPQLLSSPERSISSVVDEEITQHHEEAAEYDEETVVEPNVEEGVEDHEEPTIAENSVDVVEHKEEIAQCDEEKDLQHNTKREEKDEVTNV